GSVIRLLFHAHWSAARTALLAGGCLVLADSASAADWLHYRGPSQNGVSNEKLPPQFPAEGPRPLWKAEVGTGTSSITVSGDRAYTLGNAGGKDVLYCLDTKTGK